MVFLKCTLEKGLEGFQQIILYSMEEIHTYILMYNTIQERINLRFIGETLECQMTQVVRQTENKPSSVFNTISNGKKEEH